MNIKVAAFTVRDKSINKVYVLKFQTLFSFCSQAKCWLSGPEFTKCLNNRIAKREDTDQTAFQKQSDLGLHCLSMPF